MTGDLDPYSELRLLCYGSDIDSAITNAFTHTLNQHRLVLCAIRVSAQS